MAKAEITWHCLGGGPKGQKESAEARELSRVLTSLLLPIKAPHRDEGTPLKVLAQGQGDTAKGLARG